MLVSIYVMLNAFTVLQLYEIIFGFYNIVMTLKLSQKNEEIPLSTFHCNGTLSKIVFSEILTLLVTKYQ